MTEELKGVKHNTTVIPKMYEWGLFFWQLPDGHLFHDGNGNMLNIPAHNKYDIDAIANLRKAAAYYGQPEGRPWFQPGIRRATDEEYSEQVDRFKNGEILIIDLGAVYDAQQGLKAERNGI